MRLVVVQVESQMTSVRLALMAALAVLRVVEAVVPRSHIVRLRLGAARWSGLVTGSAVFVVRRPSALLFSGSHHLGEGEGLRRQGWEACWFARG
jgi:hypothetical protein